MTTEQENKAETENLDMTGECAVSGCESTPTDTPNSSLGKIGHKLLKDDRFIFTFLRSIVSSQAASWVDMAVRFAVFFVFTGVSPFLAVSLGCIAGGIVNCIINYHFTFHATDTSARAVAVKYFMVWAGSLLLNSGGTELLFRILERWTWLATIGFSPDGYFAAATLITSLIVSWAWNFVLQRYFVYRPNKFDPVAIRVANFLTLHKEK